MIGAFALSSCGFTGSSVPPRGSVANPRVLGEVQLEIGGSSNIAAQSYQADGNVILTRLIGSGSFDDIPHNKRVMQSTFEIKNTTNQALNNINLYAFYNSAYNQGGTAVSRLKDSVGTPIINPALAQAIKPTNGVRNNSGSIVTDLALSDIQYFLPSESQALEVETRAARTVLAADTILGYGFAVRNSQGGRIIEAGGIGQVTMAIELPLSLAQSTGLSGGALRFEIGTQPFARASRGPDETTAQAVSRAQAVGATELMLTGMDTDTVPAPLAGKRVKYPRFYNDQDVPEADIGTEGGYIKLGDARLDIDPATVASVTTFKLERLLSPPSPIPAGPFHFLSSFKVSANTPISSFQKSLNISIPVIDVTSDTNNITELHSWDGQQYIKESIGSIAPVFRIVKELPEISTTAPIRLPPISIKPPVNATAGANYTNTYMVARATKPDLVNSFNSTGGEFNGVYGMCSPGFMTLFGSCVPGINPPPKKTLLSLNAGNASLHCGEYVYKLCSYVTEERVRHEIVSAMDPDIVVAQEFWNDDCSTVPNDSDERRICSPLAIRPYPPYALQRNRILSPNIYDTRCAPNSLGGYECIGIRKSMFAFSAPSFEVSTGFSQVKSTITDYCLDDDHHGKDTGFFGQTIAILNPLGGIVPRFDLWNGHLATPSYNRAGKKCRADQINILYETYKASKERLLIVGDFNLDYGTSLDVDTSALRRLVTRYNTPIIENPQGSGKLVYMISDETEHTAFSVWGFPGKFDHVMSNFSDTLAGNKCTRHHFDGLDHSSTLCTLYGFDSGKTKGYFWGVDTFIEVPDGMQYSWNNVYRRGVQMPFVTRGLRVVHNLDLPDQVPAVVELDTGCLYAAKVSKLITIPVGGAFALGSDNSAMYKGAYPSPYCF
jgi:hypothetical protein